LQPIDHYLRGNGQATVFATVGQSGPNVQGLMKGRCMFGNAYKIFCSLFFLPLKLPENCNNHSRPILSKRRTGWTPGTTQLISQLFAFILLLDQGPKQKQWCLFEVQIC